MGIASRFNQSTAGIARRWRSLLEIASSGKSYRLEMASTLNLNQLIHRGSTTLPLFF